MDIKVNQVMPATTIEQTKETQQADGTFKFVLASQINESELQDRLTELIE